VHTPLTRVAIAGVVVGVLATVVVVVTVVDVTVLYVVVAAGIGVKMDCRVTGRTDPCGLPGGSWDCRPYSTYWGKKNERIKLIYCPQCI
jgi:hypothetical protein